MYVQLFAILSSHQQRAVNTVISYQFKSNLLHHQILLLPLVC